MGGLASIWRTNLCAAAGALAGGLAGTACGLLFQYGTWTPPALALAEIALICTLFAWLAVLLVYGVWLHYGIASIALPSLITTVIAVFATVYLLHAAPPLHVVATIVGIVIGTIVGALFCRVCRSIKADYGMR